MKTIIYSTLTLLLLSACSSAPAQEEKTKTVLDDKINVVTQAKKVVQQANAKTKENEQIVAQVKEPAHGATLYVKCASCHGKDGKKSALNASKSIAGWPSEKTQAALHGYNDGTYGGKMKAVMKAQSQPLTDEEIIKLSDYISTL
jgi:cytochrome c553